MITYRKATKKDVSALLKLYEQLNPDDKHIDLSLANNIWRKIKTNNIEYFVALDDKKIIASCYICIIPNLTRGGKSIGFIENVITDQQYRKKGIGKRIIEMAIEHAKENNCYKVLLQSSNYREGAHLFYKSIGFDGESKRAFELRLDN